MRLSVVAMSVSLSIVGLSNAADVQAAMSKKRTDIPTQGLGSALRTLAKERNFQIVYASKEISSLRSHGAVGEYTVDEALAQILSGTGMTYRYLDQETLTIVPAPAGAASTSPAKEWAATGEDSAEKAQEMTQEKTQEMTKRSFWDRFRLAQLDQAKTAGAGSVEKSGTVFKDHKLEEIIVTATKRAENVQDVPISIAVVSADDIDRRGLVGAGDYLRGIPGVNQTEAVPAQSIVIRGIETNGAYQGLNGGENTGTYFGETPTTGTAGIVGSNVDIKLVDIERVEVLRGPQGTAFGSSSMGGAVRTIPVAPKLDRFEGKVAAGYSFTSDTGSDNYNFQGVGNIPLVQDKLAVRATAYQYRDSGFYRNRAGSNPAFQAAVVIPQGAQAFAIDAAEVGSHYVIGGRIAALFQATDDLRFSLVYLTQKSETDGIPIATSGSYEQSVLQVAPEHVRRGQRLGLIDTEIDIANAVMEYDLGWADLLATASHVNGGAEYMRPMTSIGLRQARSQANESPHRGHVGEVRLATKFDGAWNFLAGLYAENSEDEWRYNMIWFGDLSRSLYPGFGRNHADYLERRDQKQNAAFGEASWEFLPGLTFTGGARAFEYSQRSRVDSSGPVFGGNPPPRLGSLEDSGTTFRANLSYKPGDDAHLYTGWSQGFRLGKPQGQIPPAALCDTNGDGLFDGTNVAIDSITSIDSDSVDSYELGGKFALIDRRLTINTAIFRMEWTGMPVSVIAPSCGWSYLANAGAARSDGVELQANLHFTDAFSVDLGGSYVDARLTKDVPAQRLFDGDRLPSPKVNANLSLQYGFDIGGYQTFVRADSIYVGAFHGGVSHAPTDESGDYVKLDVTARVVIGNFNIDLFARNLTNEGAFTSRSPFVIPGTGEFFGYQMRPRTLGVQLGYTY